MPFKLKIFHSSELSWLVSMNFHSTNCASKILSPVVASVDAILLRLCRRDSGQSCRREDWWSSAGRWRWRWWRCCCWWWCWWCCWCRRWWWQQVAVVGPQFTADSVAGQRNKVSRLRLHHSPYTVLHFSVEWWPVRSADLSLMHFGQCGRSDFTKRSGWTYPLPPEPHFIPGLAKVGFGVLGFGFFKKTQNVENFTTSVFFSFS